MPIPDKEVIAEVSCPLCKAEKGDPCVYVPQKPRMTKARQELVGLPFARAHNPRRHAARRARKQSGG
jgi:hypothetical protein